MAKGRLLAIDDEKFFRDLYRDMLSEEGYYVRTAEGGEEALEILRQEDFDLVITDMEMPGMNGVETTEAIKRFNPDQEVMVVTALREVTLAVEAMKRGVSEYILKPVNPEEFLLLINKALFRQALNVEHSKLLHENMEYFSILVSYRKCLEFLKIQDLDRLTDHILDTLMELLKAEGALLWLAAEGGKHYRVRSRRGLSAVAAIEEDFHPIEVERQLINSGQAVFVDQGSALWLPVMSGVEPLALVRVESPVGRKTFSRKDLKVADMVAEFASSALQSVLRYRSFEQRSLRVTQDGAYNMAFFGDYLSRELHKASRYGRNLSLIKLVIGNYRELNSRFLDREMEEAMTRLMDRVHSVLRDADILAMDAPNEYFILLPETDYWGALVTQKRIRKALAGHLSLAGPKKSYDIKVFIRSASFPVDGATFDELRVAVEERLAKLEKSLFYRAEMDGQPFWEIVTRLLGDSSNAPVLESGGDKASRSRLEDKGKSRFIHMGAARIDELMRAFCREVVESNRVRGIIYRGCSDFSAVRQSLRYVEGLEQSATSIFLLGGKGRTNWDFQRIHPIYIDDNRFGQTEFILYLNEDYAYALFARRDKEGLVGFHSCDFFFVENMIAKLQEQYRLQALI